MIHIEPIVFICRRFKPEGVWGDEYDGVMTIQKVGDVAYCAGAHGKVELADFRLLKAELKKYGINKFEWDRIDASTTAD
jgi:hypothetical protein